MHNLSIVNSLLGGFLIGTSAVLMMALFGRIAGISGFIHKLLPPNEGDLSWAVYFMLGLMVAGLSYHWIAPVHFTFRSNYPFMLTLVGGIFVGFGTRMGSGCTSGHGVCGISRFSFRSIVATVIFIVFGVLSFALIKPILGVV